jgi:DEAD/DEAH box helicase domain-containing protein
MSGSEIEQFVEAVKQDFLGQAESLYHHRLPRRPPALVPLPGDLHPALARALRETGVARFYRHQAEAVGAVMEGRHTAVVTPTSSGKTLAYNVPVLQSVLADSTARALYVFPIKALEQDQCKAFGQLAGALGLGEAPTAAVYDGDTPDHRRRKIRQKPPHVLITNPDMVHRSLLPYHPSWAGFFRNLRFVVLDELHNYKGVFGSHVAQVVRRLGRIARLYGAAPTVVACSATIANPAEHARALTGLDFKVVSEDGAGRAPRHFLFLNPHQSAYTSAAKLFTRSVRAGFKTIAFTKARKITELLYTWVGDALPDLRDKISSYRAGFLPEERREIEQMLFTGEMVGVIATSALEMGVDIGGLDVCILVGYPGTIINTWQRGGRVGRGGRESVIVLVALRDALDQYFMRHPGDFFGRTFESVALDPRNPQILGPHLECAAAEEPLRVEGDAFDLKAGEEALRMMERQRRLLRSADGSRIFSARIRPQRLVDIRSIGKGFTILEKGTRKIIGSIGGVRTLSECHEGAVYMHRGRTYVVTSLDIEKGDVTAEPARVNYYTRAVSDKETDILSVLRRRPAGNFVLNLGRVEVTETVTGFQKRSQHSQELLSVHELDLPPQTFETVGMWFALPRGLEEAARERGLHFMGGIHALEHAVISVFPLFTLCDRNDLGGIATPHHSQVEAPAVFLYDGVPGGIGLCEQGYDMAERLLERTLDLVSACPCEEGCPSCVHSPRCGSGNKPLDKSAAVWVLEVMLGRREVSLAAPSRVEEATEPTPPASPCGEEDPLGGRRVVVFDLETQRSAAEVGGWNNADLMRVSLGVSWNSATGGFETFFEDDVERLVELLRSADLVVGFNVLRFDYKVLSGYVPDAALGDLPTFDILHYIKTTYDFRIGLGKLAQHTLGKEKTADGLKALEWFREGRMDVLETYCRQDTEITRDLFFFGLREGYLLYERKGEVVRLPVEWDVARLGRE